MAKLFGKEFHDNSNSWFFKSSIIKLQYRELIYRKYLDENNNVVFKFEAVPKKQNVFSAKLEIVYNKTEQKVVSHFCSECGRDGCKHYLSVINYAYNFLSTDLLEKQVVQTYHTSLMEYNEYWQRLVLNAQIEIGDLYDVNTDKTRIYLKSYGELQVRLIAILAAQQPVKEDDLADIPLAEKQMKALSDVELELLKILQQNKCSFSRKGTFFTIYKDKMNGLFPVLRNLHNKVFIKETGDKLVFSDDEFRINFQITQAAPEQFLLKASETEAISAIYVGKTTYILKKNVVHSILLPFAPEVTKQIFGAGLPVSSADLIYLSSVVARQLGLIKCYLDFAAGIELPKIYNNTPVITFLLHKDQDRIIMKGLLVYADEIAIPMSLIRFPVELVRYDQGEEVSWFYIPPQIKYEVLSFFDRLPESQNSRLADESQLLFEGEENISVLKQIIFEHSDPSWNVHLSDDLKKEFVYKVTLKPVIKTRNGGKIDWFEYDVEYNYKDISFTHEELKKFFKTKEKFLRLEDGRLLYFENKEAFNTMDEILKKSEKLPAEGYKLAIYNLPYVYQLNAVSEGIKVVGDEYLDEMFEAILNRGLQEKTAIPNQLNSVMRSYQKSGFHWLKMLEKYNFNGILADDMGLGKTVQAISVLSSFHANFRAMVICPKTLLFNWAAEIEKFNPSLSFKLYEGNQKERENILETLNVSILFASYSIIQNDIAMLQEIEFDYIILDEAQHIKNATALRTKAVKKLKSRHKLALSGTPIENNPAELWSIFDFLMPGYLPALRNFKKEFMSEKQKNSQERLKLLVSPFILRRQKKDVLIELPDKQEQVSICKLTPLQEKMYLQILENVKQKITEAEANSKNNYMHILAALTRLRQVCDHPALIDKNVKTNYEFSGKTELLREIIVDAVENGNKMLIFSQFVQMLQVIKEMLIREKITFEYMDGSTENRQQVIDNFNNNNNIRTFLISLKTGGFGLNLTAADTVLIVDPWWNPMGENQAIDRTHRIGQTKKVMVYKIITKGTIEEKILSLQQTKREMFEYFIEGGQRILKSMNAAELQKLLEY